VNRNLGLVSLIVAVFVLCSCSPGGSVLVLPWPSYLRQLKFNTENTVIAADVNENEVVFSAEKAGSSNCDIFILDSNTDKIHRVTNTKENEYSPEATDTHILWRREHDNGSSYILYDRKTLEETTIFQWEHGSNNLHRLYENDALFFTFETDPISNKPLNTNLMHIYNINDKSTTVLASVQTGDYDCDGRHVVYVDRTSAIAQLISYDLETKTKIVIVNDYKSFDRVSISSDYVVWSQNTKDEKTLEIRKSIYCYKYSTGETYIVAEDEGMNFENPVATSNYVLFLTEKVRNRKMYRCNLDNAAENRTPELELIYEGDRLNTIGRFQREIGEIISWNVLATQNQTKTYYHDTSTGKTTEVEGESPFYVFMIQDR